jgi:reactive intermediate/imine deaminase
VKRVALLLLLAAGVGCRARAPELERIATPLTAGLDLPFSEVVRAGDMLYLSGMVGIRPGTMTLVEGGLEPEARQTMDNIRAMLAAAGASLDDVVRCLVMLDDISQWSRFNAIWVEYFGDARPARSAIGADGLALGAQVEVECVAVAPASS